MHGVGLEQNFRKFLLRGCVELLWPVCYPGEFFFLRLSFFFFRAVVGSQQNGEDGTETAHVLPAATVPPSPTRVVHLLPLITYTDTS